MTTMRSMILLGSFALLAACGWKSDGVARLESLYPMPSGPPIDTCALPDDPAVERDGGPSEVSLCTGLSTGQWAGRFVQYGSMSPIGTPWNLTLTDLFQVTNSPDGGLAMEFCDEVSSLSDSDGNPLTIGKTRMPDSARSALWAVPLAIPKDADGGISATEVIWVWGAKLSQPTDPLPTTSGDSRVFDQDGDGQPGVTVDVSNPNGERYMVRRATWNLAQADIVASSAGGALTFHIEENVIGASTDVLKTVAPITARAECASVYQLVCVDSSFDCKKILAAQGTLFQDAPR